MLAPFMPCGAKLPVIALFAGVFFPKASWVGPLMYFVGIVIIFFAALIINKITAYKAKKSFFIIELPEYRFPSLWGAVKSMCQRGWAFVVKAATIILLCNTAVQVMQSFSWSFEVAASAEQSILASISGPFSYIIVPIAGIVSWQLAAAAITGFIAKENVVGTLAVCLVGLGNLENVGLTPVAALAYLMFNLFTPPCFAAIAAMSAEMKSGKWLFGGIGLQFAVGYGISFLVYQIGTLITKGTFGAAFIPGLVALLAITAIIAFMCINADNKLKAAAK
jgi:ferrous iron transport protein B